MAGKIGQKMRSGQPELAQGAPTRAYWDVRRAFDREVKEALENADAGFGRRTLRLGASYGRVVAGAPTYAVIGEYLQAAGAADDVMFPLPLVEGERIIEISAWGEVAVATAWHMAFYSFDPLVGGFTPIGPDNPSSTTAGRSKVTMGSLSILVTSPLWFAIRWFSGAANNRVRAVEYKYDRP
jgi:hypothetical protein